MEQKQARKNVLLLGFTSLFTDLASQMIYPLIPEFLVRLGVNKAIIGIIEGIANSADSVLRTVFGRLSDKVQKRKPFIFFGYGLSALAKPFLFFANTWPVVLGIRFTDRIGKAARTPARDALISTSVSAEKKGRAFGFHRAMDRIGAIGGPPLALLVLNLSSNNLRLVFLLSVIPGVLALFFVALVKETTFEKGADVETRSQNLKEPAFILFLIANVVFTLGNSSNAFLILKARETGLSITLIPLIWAFYNVFCTISSPLFGSLSDTVGRLPIIILSFLYYSAVYFLFAFCNSQEAIWLLFGAYGIYYGLSEGVFRAYIADLVRPELRASAYGLFNTAIGLALFPASLIMGIIWDQWGSRWAFITSASFSMLGFLIFCSGLAVSKNRNNT